MDYKQITKKICAEMALLHIEYAKAYQVIENSKLERRKPKQFCDISKSMMHIFRGMKWGLRAKYGAIKVSHANNYGFSCRHHVEYEKGGL